ncbi:hypothetical protein G9P44_003636 [Scheffersomyces stipitis]|nr:hypothetical protein G9P44_003636 [Scheffersomyces stipitis]
MSIPEHPSSVGPFPVQHGYADIQVHTEQYSDQPTPYEASQSKANEFLANHTDREHQKKYAKKGLQLLLNVLCR